MNTNQQVGGGFPFLSILTLIFITLKLTGYISWSWLWVLAPLWIPAAIIVVILLVVFVLAVIAGASKR
jgi:hypothetical protein